MSSSVTDLPPELLYYLLTKLSAPSLASVALVSKQFYQATKIESVWEHRCLKDFGFTRNHLQGWDVRSFRIIYTKVLYPYGHIIGVWQPQIGPYGGLISIKLRDGAICGTEYSTDPVVCKPLRLRDIFRVRLTPDGYAKIECLKGPNGLHKVQILPGNTGEEFVLKCCKPEKHRYHNTRQEELHHWIREQMGVVGQDHHNFVNNIEVLRMKYIILNQHDDNCTLQRLHLPRPSEGVFLQPGLFKGTYGGHGIEIISLRYEDNKLRGYKVTGDPNVPAGQMSIEAHLDEPMVLSKRDQQTLDLIEAVDKETAIVRDARDLPSSQPFVIPEGIYHVGISHVVAKLKIQLKRCKRRYYGTGLIAMQGFRSSSRTPCHFILFTEDVFAFLWLELHSISIFHRVCESI